MSVLGVRDGVTGYNALQIQIEQLQIQILSVCGVLQTMSEVTMQNKYKSNEYKYVYFLSV